ncbi:MAG: urease subunit beta [Oscillospiraceae bacterium]|jgi:urease beta subunit|nr:urease subunit beta [Oscillospiraceae bacterium]
MRPNPDGFIFDGDLLTVNRGKETVEVTVVNTADHPIQVEAQAHFFEADEALVFPRPQAFGMRLNTPQHFAPRATKTVQLTPLTNEQ